MTYGHALTAGRPGSGTDLGSEVTVGRNRALRVRGANMPGKGSASAARTRYPPPCHGQTLPETGITKASLGEDGRVMVPWDSGTAAQGPPALDPQASALLVPKCASKTRVAWRRSCISNEYKYPDNASGVKVKFAGCCFSQNFLCWDELDGGQCDLQGSAGCWKHL